MDSQEYYKNLFSSFPKKKKDPLDLTQTFNERMDKFNLDNPDYKKNIMGAGKAPISEGDPVESWVPKDVAETFRSAIEMSDDPSEMEARLNTSYYLSRTKGISFSQAFDNMDAILEHDYGQAMSPKSAWEAVGNVFRAGVLSREISQNAYAIKKKYLNGNYSTWEEAEKDPLYQNIKNLEYAMPPQDQMKRSLPIEVLKMGMQVIPSWGESLLKGSAGYMAGYMGATLLSGMATGAAAGSVVPGIGTAAGAIAGGVSAFIPTIAALASSATVTMNTREAEGGAMFYDLMRFKDPVTGEKLNPRLAATWSTVYEGLAAAVELAQIDEFFEPMEHALDGPQRRAVKNAINASVNSVADASKRAGNIVRIADTTAGKWLLKWGAGTLSETAEEDIQEGMQIWAEESAKLMTNRLEGKNISPASKEEIEKRLVDTFVSSVVGMGVLEALPASVSIWDENRTEVNEAVRENVSQSVRAPSVAMKSIDGETPSITPEGYAKFAEQTKGQLPTGLTFGVTELVPGERYLYKVGDSQKKRLESVTVDIDPSESGATPGTVTITGFENETNPKVARALITKIAGTYAGWDIKLEPKTQFEQGLQQWMTENNPRGREAGMQFFSTARDIPQQASMKAIEEAVRAQKPGWTDEEVKLSTYTFERFANRFGMSADELASQALAPKAVEGMQPENPGRTFGAVQRTQFETGMKSLIRLGPNANASTMTHELTHTVLWFALDNRDNAKIGSFLDEAEAAFGIENHDWKGEWKGWTEEYEKTAGKGANRSGEEALAYALEDYLAFGKVESKEQEGILAKLGHLVLDLYNGLKAARVKLSPEITTFFDKVMVDSPIAQEMNLETEQEATGQEYATEGSKQAVAAQGEEIDVPQASDSVAVAQQQQGGIGKAPEPENTEYDIFQGEVDRNHASNSLALKEAKQLEADGTDEDDIYTQTGWRKVRGVWMHNPSGVVTQQEKSDQNETPEFSSAKEKFGTTANPREAGYILPDGTMLDFSGRSQAVGYEKVGGEYRPTGSDYLRNQRSMDHRDIDWEGSDNDQVAQQVGKRDAFIERGAIRVDADAQLLDMAKMPTNEQLTTIKDFLTGENGAWVELKDGNRRASIQSDSMSAAKAIGYIRRFYNGEDFPNTILFQGQEDDQGWIYKAEEVVNQKMQGPMPGRQILQTMQSSGVKSEEIKWTGLDDFLNTDKKKTPQEVKEFIETNKLNIQEVQKLQHPPGWVDVMYKDPNTGKVDTLEDWESEGITANHLIPMTQDETGEWIEREDLEPVNDQTRYPDYTLKGGENYRELLFTLRRNAPQATIDTTGLLVETTKSNEATGQRDIQIKRSNGEWLETRTGFRGTDEEALRDYAEDEQKYQTERASAALTYKSPHWKEPNVLAHTRIDDRTTSDGGKMLFVEEIQSDWHQEGRKAGYKQDNNIDTSGWTAEIGGRDNKRYKPEWEGTDALSWVVKNAGGEIVFEQPLTLADSPTQAISNAKARLEDTNDAVDQKVGRVPSAPFSKTWHEFVFKRLLRMAVDDGYDSVGWTTGEQQAERYDLSRQIDSIGYVKRGENLYRLSVLGKNGEIVYQDDSVSPSEMEGIVGKEMAQKIVDGVGRQEGEYTYLEDLDLKVGGEGMKGFYDKMLVDFANKYGKKWDAQVKDAQVDGYTVHSLPVTESMLSSVGMGQYLFQGFGEEKENAQYNTGTALQTLLSERNGYVEQAAFVPGIGDIMIPWGWEGTKAKNYEDGYGIAKILKKHEPTDNVLANLADVLENGKVRDDPYRAGRKWVVYNHYKAVIDLNRNGGEGPWLLTCYIPETWRDKESPSTGSTSIGSRDQQVQEDRPRISTDGEIIPKKRFIVKAIHRPSTSEDQSLDKKDLYQGEAEHPDPVKNAARESISKGESFEEFTSFFESGFIDQDKWGIPDLSPEKKQAWYKQQWDEALKPDTEPTLANWTRNLAQDNYKGVKNFLRMVWAEVIQKTGSKPPAGADPEEITAFLAEKDRASGLREEIAEPIIAGALAVGPNQKPLSNAFLASVYGIIKANPEEYARIYGDISGDETIGTLGKREEAKKYADIEDPQLEKPMGISERRQLAATIRDERISKAIRNGTIALDDDTKEYVQNLEKAKKSDRKQIAQLNKDIKEAEVEIDSRGKEIGAQRQELAKTEKEISKILQKTTEYLDVNSEVPPVLESQRKSFEQRRESIRAKLVEASDWQEINRQLSAAQNRYNAADTEITKAQARGERADHSILVARSEAASDIKNLSQKIGTAKSYSSSPALQTYLAKLEERTKLQDQYQERAAEQRAVRQVREYRTKLIRQMMKPAAEGANVKYKTAISDIQSILKQKYPKAMTLEQLDVLTSQLTDTVDKVTKDPAISQVVSKDLLNGIIGKRQSQLTLQDVEGLHKSIQSLRKIGRDVQESINEDRRMQADTLRNVIGTTLESLPGYQKPEGNDTTKNVAERWSEKLHTVDYSFKTAYRQLRDMDGGTNGTNVELAWNEMNRHYRAEQTQIDQRQGKILKAIKDLGHNPQDWYDQIITVPGAGKEGGSATLRKSDLMGIALAFRDENSRQAVLYGKFFSEGEKKEWAKIAEGNPDLAYQLAEEAGAKKFTALTEAIENTLDDSDMNLLDSVFEADGRETAPRLAQVVADVENRELVTIDHYFPLLRKGVADQTLAQQTAGDIMDRTPGLRRPPRNGFTKERITIAPWHQKDVETDILSLWMKSIERQEHYINFAAYGKQLDAVYLDPLVQEQIAGKFGQAGVKYITEYISEVKNPGDMKTANGANTAIQMLRGNLGTAYLAYRTSSVLKQVVTSPWPALPYAGPRLFSEAVKELANPIGYLQETESMSVVLQHRSFDYVYDLMKNSDVHSKFGKAVKNVETFGMKGLEYADRFSVAIGWRAVYEKALDEFGGDETKAIEKADQMVMTTQPMQRGVDLSPAFRNKDSAAQIVLQFTQALNVVYQNLRYDLPAAVKAHDMKTAIGISVAYMVSGTLLQCMISRPPEDDDDPKKKAARWAFYAISQGTDSIPLVGDSVTRVAKRWITGEKTNQYSDEALPGIAQFLDGLYSLSGEDVDAALEKVGRGLGTLVGAPVSGISELERVLSGDVGALVGRPRDKQ